MAMSIPGFVFLFLGNLRWLAFKYIPRSRVNMVDIVPLRGLQPLDGRSTVRPIDLLSFLWLGHAPREFLFTFCAA